MIMIPAETLRKSINQAARNATSAALAAVSRARSALETAVSGSQPAASSPARIRIELPVHHDDQVDTPNVRNVAEFPTIGSRAPPAAHHQRARAITITAIPSSSPPSETISRSRDRQM